MNRQYGGHLKEVQSRAFVDGARNAVERELASITAVITYRNSLLTMRSPLSQPEFELNICPLTTELVSVERMIADSANHSPHRHKRAGTGGLTADRI